MGNSKKVEFEIFDIGIMGSVYWGSAVWLRSGLRFVKKVPCIHSYRTCANSFWVCLWLVSDFYRKNKIFHRATFQVLSIENTDFSKKSEAKIDGSRPGSEVTGANSKGFSTKLVYTFSTKFCQLSDLIMNQPLAKICRKCVDQFRAIDP